jgi:hypothetical protein
MKISEYRVIEAYGSDLAEKVNEAIGDGWIPLGGVALEGQSMHQAMVR